jgi:AcrR family transcriptional regulator
MTQAVHHQFNARARTSQEERSQRTRQLLADSAIERLVESGYRGTTFVEVCRRAGLTRGAAHHHYRDLPALLLDALRMVNARLASVEPAVREAHGLEERIDAGIDELWRLFTTAEFRAVVEIWVAQSHDEALHDRIRSEMDRYVEIIVAGFGRFFPELVSQNADAVDLMRLLFVTLTGLGFMNATIWPKGEVPERARLRDLLKRMVHHEFAEAERLSAGVARAD